MSTINLKTFLSLSVFSNTQNVVLAQQPDLLNFLSPDTNPSNHHRQHHFGFAYKDISKFIINKKANSTLTNPFDCESACHQNEECIAWELCHPLGNGCDGCYLVKSTRPKFVSHPDWYSGLIQSRYESLEEGYKPDAILEIFGKDNELYPRDVKSCKKFLLQANGGNPDSEFHRSEVMEAYTYCGEMLLNGGVSGPVPSGGLGNNSMGIQNAVLGADMSLGLKGLNAQNQDTNAASTDSNPKSEDSNAMEKDIFILGQHYPTSLITNFYEPQVSIPNDVELELRGKITPESEYYNPNTMPGSIVSELHKSVGTKGVSKAKNHALVVPFYDTNIGHWIKEFGSMNVLQSYEMQSLLRPGDNVIDVGANLGSYTIPFAERVGRQGKVFAFEPFRWLHQLTTANVALNGLSNVYSYNLGLSDGTSSFEARPPQLRFFSSPGGVKLSNQEGANGLTQENESTMLQLYDYETEPEIISVCSLDDLLQQKLIRIPDIQSLRLIKIDVEGMESKVILGAKLAILHFKPIIWSENVDYFDNGDTNFIGIMDSLNYSCGKAQNAPNDLICVDKNGEGNQVGDVFGFTGNQEQQVQEQEVQNNQNEQANMNQNQVPQQVPQMPQIPQIPQVPSDILSNGEAMPNMNIPSMPQIQMPNMGTL